VRLDMRPALSLLLGIRVHNRHAGYCLVQRGVRGLVEDPRTCVTAGRGRAPLIDPATRAPMIEAVATVGLDIVAAEDLHDRRQGRPRDAGKSDRRSPQRGSAREYSPRLRRTKKLAASGGENCSANFSETSRCVAAVHPEGRVRVKVVSTMRQPEHTFLDLKHVSCGAMQDIIRESAELDASWHTRIANTPGDPIRTGTAG
jgi:hypothetical protein